MSEGPEIARPGADRIVSGDHAAVRPILEQELAGHYELLEEIGHGAMAIVFRARDVRHDRLVALKVLRPELAVAMGAERFLREIRIEARLNHPNVLALFDSGQCGHLLYYVAPWADEGSLKDRLLRETRLSVEDARRITCEVGEALAHAHANGIVHRDVKPDNILFRSGHAMLADFGIAHAIAERGAEAITQTGIVVGTPLYMSPEQGLGVALVDARSDQYALACIMYEMLTGDPPFTGRSAQAILARHQIDHPPSLTALRPDVSTTIVAAIARALQKQPQDRFANVSEFIATIGAYDSGSHGMVAISSRLRRFSMAAVVAVVAVAAVFGLLRWRATSGSLSSTKVAVFPLGVRGLVPGDSGIGVGIAYLCAAALERADPLRLIDIASELSAESMQNPESISGALARRIARRAKAEWALRGVIQGHSDSVTLILRLYSVSGDSLVKQVSVTGAVQSAPLHHLGIDAIKQLIPVLIDPTRVVDLGPLRDRSAPSIALWMQGERRYRLSKFAEARGFYERALAEDSGFALAAVKGAQSASWLHDHVRALSLVSLAIARDSLLPPRYVAFARGLRFSLRGEADSAVARFLAVQQASPDWAEASTALGEVYYHMLPTQNAHRLAAAAFAHAMVSDSGFTPPLFHLAEFAFREGRLADGNALVDQFRRSQPEEGLLGQLSLMRSCLMDGTPLAWTGATTVNPKGTFEAAKSLSTGAQQNRCAEAGFRAVLRSLASTDGERWGAFLGLQALMITRGAHAEARALIDSSVQSGKGVSRSLYVLASLAGADMSESARALDAYARLQYGDDYGKVRSAEALWVLSCWHLAMHDGHRVRLLADLLEARADSTHDQRDRMFATSAFAHVAVMDGDTARAIGLLQSNAAVGNPSDIAWGFGATLAPDRLLLARLLLSSGRARESLAAAAVFDHSEPIMFVGFIAASLSVQYQAARSLGDGTAAATARRRLERLDRQDLIK